MPTRQSHRRGEDVSEVGVTVASLRIQVRSASSCIFHGKLNARNQEIKKSRNQEIKKSRNQEIKKLSNIFDINFVCG
jgi:hypothetical protein